MYTRALCNKERISPRFSLHIEISTGMYFSVAHLEHNTLNISWSQKYFRQKF